MITCGREWPMASSGTPPTLTAFQPLLVSVATINGLDFVTRG